MSDKEHPVVTCEECDLDCQYRGISPLVPDDSSGNAFTCTVIQEDKKSCLVSVPVSVMVDTTTGKARTVRVDFVRIKKGSKWKRRKP